MFILVIQRLFIESILEVIYFPIWWYTAGAKYILILCFDLFRVGNQNLSPGLWLKNIFVPMFGQYDWQGRIISFLMRFVQVIFRTLALFVWLILCLLLFFIWLSIPVIIALGLFLSL